MDNTLVSVLAALGGSVIGASTPVLSNFVLQRSVAQRELTNRTRLRNAPFLLLSICDGLCL
jgi:hypothetical protein